MSYSYAPAMWGKGKGKGNKMFLREAIESEAHCHNCTYTK